MHSYLFIGPRSKDNFNEVSKLATNTSSRIIEFDASTIANVKEIIQFVNLSSTEKQIIYLPNMQNASEPAQNSLLKTLEEDHKNTMFALTCEYEESVLETIRSRCEIIRVKAPHHPQNQTYEEFSRLSIKEKFEKVNTITDREDATTFLKDYIDGASRSLPEDHSLASTIEVAQIALYRIKNNGNVHIQLTYFLTSLLSPDTD